MSYKFNIPAIAYFILQYKYIEYFLIFHYQK